MIIDKKLIDDLRKQAESYPRKRAYYDLRNGAEDELQRMLVAIPPSDAKEVIHLHCDSSESLCMICGHCTEIFYDEKGDEIERFDLNPSIGNYGLQVPVGVFHTLIAHAQSVFMESKSGRGMYAPLVQEDL